MSLTAWPFALLRLPFRRKCELKSSIVPIPVDVHRGHTRGFGNNVLLRNQDKHADYPLARPPLTAVLERLGVDPDITYEELLHSMSPLSRFLFTVFSFAPPLQIPFLLSMDSIIQPRNSSARPSLYRFHVPRKAFDPLLSKRLVNPPPFFLSLSANFTFITGKSVMGPASAIRNWKPSSACIRPMQRHISVSLSEMWLYFYA